MDWKTTYPTVADVKEASMDTLLEWDKHLPEPETDVQRTVQKRIERRLMEHTGNECREKAPEIVDKWNELMGMCEKLGISNPGKM